MFVDVIVVVVKKGCVVFDQYIDDKIKVNYYVYEGKMNGVSCFFLLFFYVQYCVEGREMGRYIGLDMLQDYVVCLRGFGFRIFYQFFFSL